MYKMRHYDVEEKFAKVCEGLYRDEGCDEQSEVKRVWC